MKWGRVDVPELSLLPLESKLRGWAHLPTGLRWVQLYSDYPGEYAPTRLLGPEGANWGADVYYGAPYGRRLRDRADEALGIGPGDAFLFSGEDIRSKELEIAQAEGMIWQVGKIRPVKGLGPVPWDIALRDALVLLILMRERRYEEAPFPSVVHVTFEEMPTALRGSFVNPLWKALN